MPNSSVPQSIHLIVRRTIQASPERLFDAWTDPEQLKHWWGPPDVKCVDASIDLQTGGQYRIVNQDPDGKLVAIIGEFEAIIPPSRLVYTWRMEQAEPPLPERVTVQFNAKGDKATEVIVLHERITTEAARNGYEIGWTGCLHGLIDYMKRITL